MNNTNTNHDRSSRRSSRNTTIVSKMEAVLEMDRTSAEFQSQGFPLKLFVMLEDAPIQNFEHVIAWSPDGASFRIRNPEAFAEDIMFRYFRHQTKYKSFQRQLNIYGFRKVPLGPTKGAYSHEFFLRHQPGFLHRIERKTTAAHAMMTKTSPAFAPPPPRIRDSLLSAADFVSSPPPRPILPHHHFYPTETISSDHAPPAQHEDGPSLQSIMRDWEPIAVSSKARDLVDHEKVTAASENHLTTRVSPLTSTKRPPASFEAPRAIMSSEQSSEAHSYYYHYNPSTYVRLPPPPVYPRGEADTHASTRYYDHQHPYPYPHQHQQYQDPYYQQRYQYSNHQLHHYDSDKVAVHGDMPETFQPRPPPLGTASMVSNSGTVVPGTTKPFSPFKVDGILADDDGNDLPSPSSILGGEGNEEMESPTAGDKPWQSPGGGPDEHHRYSFPLKLYQMLEDSSKGGFSDICSWVQDGTAFKVHNIDAFMAQVSHKYFDHSKYESLRRQLNLYNFHRVSKGPDRGTYSHPLFRRGHWDLCHKIERSYAISNSPGQDTDGLEKIDNDSIVLQAGDDNSSPCLQENGHSQNANCYRLDENNHWRNGPRVASSFDQMTARGTRIHQREEEPNISPHPI